MNIPKINNTSFQSIHVDRSNNYSENQKEAIRKLHIKLLGDYNVDRKGRNIYERLSAKGYDFVIKSGKNNDDVKVIIGKCVMTQDGIEDINNSSVIGYFNKENAYSITDKLKEKKHNGHLTLMPLYAALIILSATFGITKCSQNNKIEDKINTSLTDTIKSNNNKANFKRMYFIKKLLK